MGTLCHCTLKALNPKASRIQVHGSGFGLSELILVIVIVTKSERQASRSIPLEVGLT